MISAKCVPLGMGTDVGGSIRIPAHFNGVVGFKPTQTRLSARDMCPTFSDSKYLRGHETIVNCPGPLGTSVTDVLETFKLMADTSQHLRDPYRAPLNFN
jgi:Asp-tRNA(Asn)/Glu-tRNA(Gln) amidotransferase A subunit family amidase